jgi:uncharacterized protein (TIGR03083 family)
MADNAKTWKLIHAERQSLVDTLAALAPEQWTRPSLCAGWTVRIAAAHVLAGAEQTPSHFLAGLLSTGLRFNALMTRDARTLGALEPGQIVDRLRRTTTTTNHPPAPVPAMLGEVVVHGEDIRRPLGLPGAVCEQAALACLQMYQGASFPVGGRKRIQGLRLVATDIGWSHGDGPEVSGGALSLLLAMTGRAAGLAGLSGDGVTTLAGRLPAPP